MSVCKTCNKSFPQEMKFCPFCGKELESEEKITEDRTVSSNVKKAMSPQRTILIIALVAVLVAFTAIVAVLLIVGISSEKPNYALYMQDGDLIYVEVNRREPIVISENFDEILDKYGFTMSEYLGELITVTRDRQHIIYVNGISEKGGFSLYVKSLRDPESSEVKISSSVIDYVPSPDGETIVYREYDGDLYRYNINSEDKEKISTDVDYFIVSENGKRVIYVPAGANDDELFLDGEQIAVNISDIEHYSADLSFFAYSKGGALYTVKNFGEPQKVAEKFSSVYALTDDGAFYYSVDEEVTRSLYYCDENTNELVSTNFNSFVCCADDSPYAVIKEIDGEKMTYRVLFKADSYDLDLDELSNHNKFIFGSDGRSLYYIDDYDAENEVGTLWLTDIARNGEVRSKEKIDTDVDYRNIVAYNDSILYFKDVSEEGYGDLYIDGKLVDYEVTLSRIDEENEAIYYYTNRDSNLGTLKVYRDGKSEKISENVYMFDISFGGEVFYISNYSTAKQEGELYLYRNGKSILIENDVLTLIKVYNRK